MTEQPNLREAALGGFFQDIGKFMQRAHGAVNQIKNPVVHRQENVILPTDGRGGYTHKHVLWTEAFFQWMEDEGLGFPIGVNLAQVRNMAVFHHKPDAFDALGWLQAEADRLSSGMDRKPKDEMREHEAELSGKGWDAFIKTPLRSLFQSVDLGLGTAQAGYYELAELIPDKRLLPESENAIETGDWKKRYRALWDAFAAEFKALCQPPNVELFCAGLLSLSERYTWAIPSSTTDLPDIALHDHNRTVAAIAACLHAWHEADGSLSDTAKIKDRQLPKFRLLAGDLSGIQHTLFILANQQVKGVNKILRARSFLMGLLLEAAALRTRQILNLPVFNLIQDAGGRFMMLIPALADTETRIKALQTEIDDWMRSRYLGELSLNLALSEPFGGEELMPAQFPGVQASLNRALETAKQRTLAGATGILQENYSQDECGACGVRPARHGYDEERRCHVCHDEHRVGGWLPKTAALSWQSGARQGDWAIRCFGDLHLHFHGADKPQPAVSGLLSAFRLYQDAETLDNTWPLRFAAHYVPRLRAGEHYEDLDEDSQQIEPGEFKTLAMLAQDALESHENERIGKPFLAVLKADVDRLGFIFGYGLRDPDPARDRNTLSRHAALSRMLDLFFTGYLQTLLRERFADTYTVYAGGDDLLLLGPWRQMVQLTAELNDHFRRYTGHNPNITLSAGLALTKVNHPLNRTLWEAEERLEQAKDTGRDRVCLIGDDPVSWEELPALLERAEKLTAWLRDKLVSTALVYKLLYFAAQRRRAEQPDENGKLDMNAVNWRAKWAYHLARNVRDNKALKEHGLVAEVEQLMNQLLGLTEDLKKQAQPPATRIPVSIALYRNRV